MIHSGRRRHPRRRTLLAACAGLAVLLTLASGWPPFWHGQMAFAGRLEEIARLLREDDSYKVRVQAANLLGKLGDPRAVAPLSGALHDPNKTVRWMAVEALMKIGDAAAVPALQGLLSREKDKSVRSQVARALATLGQKRNNAKIFLSFGSFSGGAASANAEMLEVLRSTLRRELGKLTAVTFEGGDPRTFGKTGLIGFLIDGNVSRLDDGMAARPREINCDVKVMVARWPSKSIILWTSAGAAVEGGSRPQDIANSRRDCLEASAGQLAEDLMKFFKSQGG